MIALDLLSIDPTTYLVNGRRVVDGPRAYVSADVEYVELYLADQDDPTNVTRLITRGDVPVTVNGTVPNR